MKFVLEEANATRWDVISDVSGHVGAIYWFGSLPGHQENPYNLVLNKKDMGMFVSVEEIRVFLEDEA
ncbi:hypothetical protein PHYNN_163 [Pantoea phage Phynn]|nr:hypothetical protein PHYNN_163 [Pantoea phage Phynn]